MNKIITLVFACFAFISFAFAQSSSSSSSSSVQNLNLIVRQPSITMARSRGGAKMGEVYINTPVTLEKEEGDWALVTLKTWVKKEGLGAQAVLAPAKQAVSTPSTDLVIEKFSTKIVQEGLPEKRVYLSLKLKNNTAKPINSWKAMLVAQANSTVLFREQISDDTKPIATGQSVELNFYWEPSEQPYQYLQDATPETVKLELYQVIIE